VESSQRVRKGGENFVSFVRGLIQFSAFLCNFDEALRKCDESFDECFSRMCEVCVGLCEICQKFSACFSKSVERRVFVDGDFCSHVI